jgi:hypothetical protein
MDDGSGISQVEVSARTIKGPGGKRREGPNQDRRQRSRTPDTRYTPGQRKSVTAYQSVDESAECTGHNDQAGTDPDIHLPLLAKSCELKDRIVSR